MKITSTKQVCRLMRGLRLHADMSAVELGRRLRVSGNTVHHREIERAKALSVEALVEIADVFGMDVVLIRRDTGKPA